MPVRFLYVLSEPILRPLPRIEPGSTERMADFSPSRLSPASRILLGSLLVLNLLVLGLALTTDDTPSPVVERKLPARTDPLKLLGELSESDRQSLTRSDNRPAPRATFPEEPTALVCRAWGPFASDETLEPVRIAVAAVTDRLEVRNAKVAAAPDYLVYLDTDNNIDNARRLQQELESQDIDAYVIAGGPFLNAVSAGVFSQRSSADRLMQRLKDLGYVPRIESLERVEEVRQLVARVPEGFHIPGMTDSPCPAIASQDDFL